MGILGWFSRATTRGLASVSGPVVARYRFVFGRERCQIQAVLNSGLDHNTQLAISYVAFLFRLFQICDVNQIEPVSTYLSSNIGGTPDCLPHEFQQHSARLHAIVMATYDQEKQDAAERVFKGLPPAYKGYGSEPIPGEQTRYTNLPGTLGAYELAVTTKGVPLFDMGGGPHLALLPQTVLLFYAYVVDHFKDANVLRPNWGATPKHWLDQVIRAQVETHSRWDPQASSTMVNGTRELLKSLAYARYVVTIGESGEMF